jgi:type II secretory pathway component GspD/PulD (secretin)
MSHVSVLGAALTITLLSAMTTTQAQNAIPSTEPTKLAELPQPGNADTREKMEWRYVRIRNIKPSVMAWWLDPKHNPEPAIFANARRNRIYNPIHETKLGDSKPTPAVTSELGPGVDKIIPVDPQNTLLILATEQGATHVKSLVTLLDRPFRQVEVEGLFIEMNNASTQELGITFNNKEEVALGSVRNNFRTILNKLVAENKVKILNAPRVTALNNLTVQLGSRASTPTTLGIQDENGKFQPLADSNVPGTSQLFLQTATDFIVTPTINNDNTITLALSPSKTLRLAAVTPDKDGETKFSDPIYVKQLDGINTVVNVRDGETIVLRGLPRTFFSTETPKAGEAKPDHQKSLYLFVTPRILRRLEDINP